MEELRYDRVNVQKYEFNLLFDNNFIMPSQKEQKKVPLKLKEKRLEVLKNWDNLDKKLNQENK